MRVRSKGDRLRDSLPWVSSDVSIATHNVTQQPGLCNLLPDSAKRLLFSRRVAPECCHCTVPNVASRANKKGRRSAERRTGRIRTCTSDESIRTRGQCGERHE